MIKQDVASLTELLKTDPRLGVEVIKGCYKIRMAITSKGKGKSGGARIITYVWVQETTVLLLTIYNKSDTENVPASAIKELLKGIGLK